MRKFQLRTYHFRTEAAASNYLPHWKLHIRSLKLFGVETHGFFSVPTVPRDVVAIISFAEDADPEEVTQNYMESEPFKEDMKGFDIGQITGVDTLLLIPGPESPLG